MPISTKFESTRFQFQSISRVATILSFVAALVGMVFSLWQFGVSRNLGLEARLETTSMEAEKANATIREAQRVAMAAEELHHDAEVQQERIEKLLAQIHSATGRPLIAQLDPRDKQTLEDLKTTQATLDQKMKTLEAAIMSDPIKAVSLPLMRKDLDSLQDKSKSDIEAVRGEIARLYSLIQWFIGLMFTIALGVFGLAIGNIVKGERKSDDGRKNDSQQPSHVEAAARTTWVELLTFMASPAHLLETPTHCLGLLLLVISATFIDPDRAALSPRRSRNPGCL